jgi:hypothetical protein
MVPIPWMVAMALQADGWYLRSDIVWSKPNPMPESVTDRPTKAHEYVFLLTKQPRYWFDAEAVRERSITNDPRRPYTSNGALDGRGVWHSGERRDGDDFSARNVRSVWTIATQPYPEAHFATYPEELVRRCLLAGCPEWVCRTCGKPRERLVEEIVSRPKSELRGKYAAPDASVRIGGGGSTIGLSNWHDGRNDKVTRSLGWSDCGHNDDYRPGRVLDPFLGSGTTALVARRHGRACVGIELNPAYAQLAARRLQQLSLLAEGIA